MNDWAEFRHFKYLLAIVEHKGFRAAAEHLRTAEPNLSVQARQFQEEFAIRLFKRAKNGSIELTETGVAFPAIARCVFDARDDAIAALIAIDRGQVRTLNLGCAPFVDPELFRMACEIHKEVVPSCLVRPTHGDAVELVQELVQGEIDAAIMTLPISDSRLRVQAIRRDRLVACLRFDDPLAEKAAVTPADLQDYLAILYHPQRHPGAHKQLLELLREAGVQISKFSRASHPTELQWLVKAGYGLALISEGTALETELTTRPIAGVDWAIDTAFVYNKKLYPKTIPVLAQCLKKRLTAPQNKSVKPQTVGSERTRVENAKRTPRAKGKVVSEYSKRRFA